MEPIGSKLATALVAAQQAARAVEKDSINQFHRYHYASAEALIAEGRGALGAARLTLITMGWRMTTATPPWFDALHVTYLLAHESGECMTFEAETAVVPEKGRPIDKAQATALTYNLGYFLRGLLLLPRVEEGTDADQRDDRNQGQRRPQQRQGNDSRDHDRPPPDERTNGQPPPGKDNERAFLSQLENAPTIAAVDAILKSAAGAFPDKATRPAGIRVAAARAKERIKAQELPKTEKEIADEAATKLEAYVTMVAMATSRKTLNEMWERFGVAYSTKLPPPLDEAFKDAYQRLAEADDKGRAA